MCLIFSVHSSPIFPSNSKNVEVCSKPYLYWFVTAGDPAERHAKRMTQDKPYACTTCHKTFSRKEHLDNHVRSHTGETPYRYFLIENYHSENCGFLIKMNYFLNRLFFIPLPNSNCITTQLGFVWNNINPPFVPDASSAQRRSLAKNTWWTTCANTRARHLTAATFARKASREKNILWTTSCGIQVRVVLLLLKNTKKFESNFDMNLFVSYQLQNYGVNDRHALDCILLDQLI